MWKLQQRRRSISSEHAPTPSPSEEIGEDDTDDDGNNEVDKDDDEDHGKNEENGGVDEDGGNNGHGDQYGKG